MKIITNPFPPFPRHAILKQGCGWGRGSAPAEMAAASRGKWAPTHPLTATRAALLTTVHRGAPASVPHHRPRLSHTHQLLGMGDVFRPSTRNQFAKRAHELDSFPPPTSEATLIRRRGGRSSTVGINNTNRLVAAVVEEPGGGC